MMSDASKTKMPIKKYVYTFLSMFFLYTFFFIPWVEAASPEATKVAMAISRMQKMSFADIEIRLTAEEKNALKEALLSDKILPEEPNALGSQLYALVTLKDNKDVSMIIGITGTDTPVVIMKPEDYGINFDITKKNLSMAETVAKKIANRALKNKTTNIEAVLSSFAFIMNTQSPESNPIMLSDQERKELPTILVADSWKFTNNFNYEKAKFFDIAFIRSPTDEDGTSMSFSAVNGLYFANLSFYNDFDTVSFEVPRQTLINVGISSDLLGK